MVMLDKHRCALLVVDMPEYFRSMTEPIISNITQLSYCCQQAQVPIIFTRQAHTNPVDDGGMLAKWWGELILDGTLAADILSEIKPLPSEKIVHKKRYAAFFQTDLHNYLQNYHIKQLIIAGEEQLAKIEIKLKKLRTTSYFILGLGLMLVIVGLLLLLSKRKSEPY